MRAWLLLFGLLAGSLCMSATPQAATKIQEITTPGGLKAWLLPTHNLPMVSIELSFRAGSVFEPAGKEGLAQFTASLLDEGAGPYNATAFKEELEAIGARFGASADTLDISLNLTTLKEHQGRAFELLGLAAREPKFDATDVARVRSQLLANLKRIEEDPAALASRALRPALFGPQAWANDGEGTEATLNAIAPKDLMGWHLANLTRSNLTISVVGDIDAANLGKLLDDNLGQLPQGAGRRGKELATPQVGAPTTITKTLAVPQGTVLLGWNGMACSDPDYPALMVMNEIFGGGVLTSRLGLDVREKHGLVYDIRSRNNPLPEGGFYVLSFATDAKKVAKALSLIDENIEKIRTQPVSQEEFDDAQNYLIGSWPLRLDSNAKLLGMMSLMQNEGLGADYIERWPTRLAAVKFADIQRVAQRMLTPNTMSLIVVGQNEALSATWPLKK
jgi:zinc protease